MNKEYKMKEEYKGTYLEALINEYNKVMNDPYYFDRVGTKTGLNNIKSLRIEIAEVRKQMKREGKIKG